MKVSIQPDRLPQKVLMGMTKDICILGAGGHAKVVIELAEMLKYDIKSIFDQDKSKKNIFHYSVEHDSEKISENRNVFLALGNNQNRKIGSEKYETADFNLIHPSGIISKSVKMGYGNALMAGVIINSSVQIGDHCIINTGSCIDHDCRIDNFVHISPKAALAGNVKVKEGAQIGIGACIKQNITVGKWAVVGAGAVVINDVPDFAVVVGNPAKILRFDLF